MHLSRKLATASLATAFLAASAGSVLAMPAHATGSVNVRTGPGVGYHRVDALSPGEYVDVRGCQYGWCFITHRGADGWVSANYLSRNSVTVWRSPRPNVTFSFSFGSPGYGFSFGNPAPSPWPRHHHHHYYNW